MSIVFIILMIICIAIFTFFGIYMVNNKKNRVYLQGLLKELSAQTGEKKIIFGPFFALRNLTKTNYLIILYADESNVHILNSKPFSVGVNEIVLPINELTVRDPKVALNKGVVIVEHGNPKLPMRYILHGLTTDVAVIKSRGYNVVGTNSEQQTSQLKSVLLKHGATEKDSILLA